MPLVTTAEVKTYLRITASTYDSIITTLIPAVQEDIANITNNIFETRLYIAGEFEYNASAYTMTLDDSTADLKNTYGFADGDDIYITGSYRNDGYHAIQSVTTNVITLASTETIYAEISSAAPYVYVVKWPKELKPIAANMIRYGYESRPTLDGMQSESLGGYSYSRSSMIGGYPETITQALLPWMYVGMK
jgi:hypothetical protein